MKKRFTRNFIPVLLLLLSANLNAQVYNGDLTLTSQAEVDAFNYTSVTGDLTIQETVPGNITNLNGLSELSSVGGAFRISGNTALVNINGFGNLTSVGGILNISDNGGLTTVTGLSKLATVGGGLGLYSSFINYYWIKRPYFCWRRFIYLTRS